MGSIKLSPRNGVNPTIRVCPYCGKDKDILLLGAAGDNMARELGRTDGEMPMRTYFEKDYEPCPECAEKGVVVLVVDHEPVKGEKPDVVDAYLLGRKLVPFVFHPETIARNVLDKGVALMDRTSADKLKSVVSEISAAIDKEGSNNDN